MVNKYKLIKEYPGSRKIGYISDCCTSVNSEHYLDGNWFDPALYPEYWEKIVEKDYEILQFICKKKRGVENVGTILTKQPDGSFWIYPHWTEEAMLKLSHYAIYSVKRLSDGEIFTIGDKLDGCGVTTSISLFRIEDNILKVGLREVGVVLLGVCKHKKEPLLTTEDGVEIFHEGVPVVIYSKLTYGQLYSGLYFKSLHDQFSYTKILFFAKKENALNWVEENESKYSKKDMISFAGYSRGISGSTTTPKCLEHWLESPYNTKK